MFVWESVRVYWRLIHLILYDFWSTLTNIFILYEDINNISICNKIACIV